MRSPAKIALAILASFALSTTIAEAASISGTITGPDGAAFRGAFVQARNAKTKITVSVLSDSAGKYRIGDLPAGEYRVAIKASARAARAAAALSVAPARPFDAAIS